MIRDITIGQYYPADSVLHRLDPRVKLVGTLVFLISLFLFDSLIGYIVAGLFLATMIKISKVPFSFIVRGLKTIIVLMLFTVTFNLFLTEGQILWQWKFFKQTLPNVRGYCRTCRKVRNASVPARRGPHPRKVPHLSPRDEDVFHAGLPSAVCVQGFVLPRHLSACKGGGHGG